MNLLCGYNQFAPLKRLPKEKKTGIFGFSNIMLDKRFKDDCCKQWIAHARYRKDNKPYTKFLFSFIEPISAQIITEFANKEIREELYNK